MSGPFFIARRLFWKIRRERSHGRPLFGASLGIALSLVPLVTVDHVADGMIEGIIARYRETSTYHFQIRSWGNTEREEWAKLIRLVEGFGDVGSVWIERRGFALARAAGARQGLTLRAVPKDAPRRDPQFGRYIEFDAGSWNLGENDILLGREAARRLGVSVGENLLVLTAKNFPNGRYVPKVSQLTVRGIFSSGYRELDRTWAFIPLELGWTILSPESSQTFAGGKIVDLTEESAILSRLAASLPDKWNIYDWRDINRRLLNNLESTRSILLFIMALIILVAVFNVMSSLVMLVLERRREIGILKCTGSSPASISRTFVITGVLAATAGTPLGLGGGLVVAYFVNSIIAGLETLIGFLAGIFTDAPPPSLLNENYYLQHIPIRIRWLSTGIIGIITLSLSTVVSWIPASRAAGLRPLNVLRKH